MSINEYDAIVVGTGISGGWAAKELTESGLKTLVLERGRMIEHVTDYHTAHLDPWDMDHGGRPTKEDLKRHEKTSSSLKVLKTLSKEKFKITGDVSGRAPKVNQADVSKKAKEFTKKINKERIVKQKNIFGGEDTVKTKKKTSILTSRGTRTKTPAVPGQKKLKLGTYTKGKVLPKQTLKPGGVIKTDLRTVPKKYPRGQRPKMSPAELKKVVKQASKPEKMVTVKDPVKGGFREVGATTKQGKNVLKTKQSVSTDDLINPNSSKPQPKPKNLFGRIKGRIKGFYSNPEKSDFRTNRKSLDGSFSTTRNVYKGKTGAVKKFFDKMPRGNRRAALTIAAIAGAGMLAKRALSPTPKVEPKIYTTKKSKLTLKSTEDLGYRSKGAKKNKSLP